MCTSSNVEHGMGSVESAKVTGLGSFLLLLGDFRFLDFRNETATMRDDTDIKSEGVSLASSSSEWIKSFNCTEGGP